MTELTIEKDRIPAICGGSPVRNEKLYYSHQDINDKDISAVIDVLKSDYLTTNQTISFFGTEIEIPFGNPPVDKDAKITELEAKVEELEAKLTQSSSGENNTVGDVDGSGDVDAGDATVILQYAAYLGAGGTGTLPDYLAQLETA